MTTEVVPLIYKPIRIDFDGKCDGVVKNVIKMNFQPEKPTEIFKDGARIFAPCLKISLGMKITQSRFQIDRAAPYAFALAVEDCVKPQLLAG
jgi:hypothetical protein